MRRKKIDLPSLFWRDIDGYEGLYQVSVDGEMKSLKWGKERVLKPWKGKDGYLHVNLCKDGKRKSYLVHRLVAQAWLPNPDNLPEVNHIDEIKTNNRAENLEWCTRIYNMNWGTCNERVTKANSKPVIALDKQGRIVHVFPSTAEAGRNGFNQGNVVSCCKGTLMHYKNLIWYYQDDFLKKIC